MDVTLRSNFVATPIYHESPTAPWCTFDNNTAHAFISKCEKGFGGERQKWNYLYYAISAIILRGAIVRSV